MALKPFLNYSMTLCSLAGDILIVIHNANIPLAYQGAWRIR